MLVLLCFCNLLFIAKRTLFEQETIGWNEMPESQEVILGFFFLLRDWALQKFRVAVTFSSAPFILSLTVSRREKMCIWLVSEMELVDSSISVAGGKRKYLPQKCFCIVKKGLCLEPGQNVKRQVLRFVSQCGIFRKFCFKAHKIKGSCFLSTSAWFVGRQTAYLLIILLFKSAWSVERWLVEKSRNRTPRSLRYSLGVSEWLLWFPSTAGTIGMWESEDLNCWMGKEWDIESTAQPSDWPMEMGGGGEAWETGEILN